MPDKPSRYSIYTDEELMIFLRRGKVDAFDEIYLRYSGLMMRYFVRMLNYNRTLAEDALQELFLKVAESPARFDSTRSFKTWIYCIASNACKNFYRHKTLSEISHQQIYAQNEEFEDSSFYNLASKIDAGVFRQMLDEVLEKLPCEKKEAFILKYQDDKSLAEIAEIQQCALGSVKSRLHYTIKILEQKLKIFNPVNQ